MARKKESMFIKNPSRPGAKLPFRILLTLVFLLPAVNVSATQKITIGLLPEMNVFAQMERYRPLAEYLSREIGIDVKLSMLSRYGNIIERLRTQDIDAAFLGSFTGALAISQLGVIPIARPINPDNTSTYHGLFFTRKGSNIEKFSDMRGKTMAFVEQATTAGYIFPLAWLKKQGADDHTVFFKEFFFTGSHDAAIDAVLTGKADIGAAKNTIYELYLEKNPAAQKELIIIASSEPVPSNGLCVMPTTDKEIIEKLQKSLLDLHTTPQGRTVLEKLHALKFVNTDATDYEPVVTMAGEAGINLRSYNYQNR